MKTLVVALAIAFVVPLHAQDLAPELAPLVAKHKADLAALDAQKAAATARVQQTYVAALDGAEKTATVAGNLAVVAAITKEREALKTGLMAPALPEGLPKTLQPASMSPPVAARARRSSPPRGTRCSTGERSAEASCCRPGSPRPTSRHRTGSFT